MTEREIIWKWNSERYSDDYPLFSLDNLAILESGGNSCIGSAQMTVQERLVGLYVLM